MAGGLDCVLDCSRVAPAAPQALTLRQREVLLAIQDLSAPRVQPPSYAEIAALVGGSAVSVMNAVHRLHDKGYITRRPDKHRTIRVLRPIAA